MQQLTVLYRLFKVFYYLVSGMLQIVIFFPRSTPAQKLARIQRWSQNVLAIFNIRVVAYNLPELCPEKGRLIVANHVSWLDIFALNAVLPGRFIAKEDVRKWPMIGYLAAQAQTVFISRQRGSNTTQGKVQGVAQALRFGEQVTLFPEGTSSDGAQVLGFKSSFFQAAIDANVSICPLLIFYPDHTGTRCNSTMAYYGDISLLQSLKALAKQQSAVVELHFFPALESDDQTRRELADHAQHQLAQALAKRLRQGQPTAL
ncbi:1-acyl-sn-glycerol-3-phosphate acyltransferase [Pasteurellaceae bacterium HPA106]|uniref:lysophospholipid acyltransferase family protein n=1 Tax=Spirabiliibacterium pneumoniae TaxID=221400 RepID=UPI001AACC6C5|nr:lysophospholipid acyltransferase family protein [Spirabiliibacterium pneumoniae]MBE2895366.1 1-acyl-sn-glycerol-3-phosphate acyltransferase [Spirabiliibacterium pneumoniae]